MVRTYRTAVATFVAVSILSACGTTLTKSQQRAGLAGELGVNLGAAPAGSTGGGTDGGTVTDPTTATGDPTTDAPGDPTDTSVPTTDGGTATGPVTTTGGGPVTTGGSTKTTTPGKASPSKAGATSSAAPTKVSIGKGPILVGLGYIDQGANNAVVNSIGKGLATADTKAETDAYVADINAHGGVLGRPIKMVYYKASTSDSLQAIGQGLCQKETQDNHVVVSLDGNYGGVVYPCMTKAKVATISPQVDGLTTSDYAKYPYLSEPGNVSLDRLATLETQSFAAMGYKPTGLQKLGVLYYSSASFVAGFNALKAAWKTQGVTVTDSVAFSDLNAVSDLAGLEAAVQGAELKFAAEGITHVMCVETNAFLCGFFGVYASSQGYRPRYAYTSMQPLTNVLANVPAESLKGSVFVGWNPAQDQSTIAQMPAGVQSCLTFMNKHGFPTDTGNQRDAPTVTCESFDYLIAAIKAGGGATSDAIVAGARKLGASYPSRRTLGVTNRADGVGVVRRGVFDEKCACFIYTSDPISVS